MCDSCASKYGVGVTAGTVGAYSGYNASKMVSQNGSKMRGNNYDGGMVRRRSPLAIIFGIIIAVILIGLIIWLISAFFWCKNTKQNSNNKKSCEGGQCTNSSDCEPGLTCSNGVCVTNC